MNVRFYPNKVTTICMEMFLSKKEKNYLEAMKYSSVLESVLECGKY